MPISLDATSNGGATDTSLTFAHTCTGENRILFVGVGIENAADVITGVTYDGVAMTLVDKQENGTPNEWTYLFYLIAPATGANNVVVSSSASVAIRGVAVSYAGARQSGQPDASAKATAAAATEVSDSVTIVTGDSWVISVCQRDSGAPTAGTGVTLRDTSNNTRIGDSNGAQSAGAYSMTWTGTSAQYNLVMASFAPAPDEVTETGGVFLLS